GVLSRSERRLSRQVSFAQSLTDLAYRPWLRTHRLTAVTRMNYFNFLAGGAALGVIAACWGTIKGVLWKLVSTLVQRVEVSDTKLCQTLVGYLVPRYPRSRVYDRVYGATYEHIKGRESSGLVPYELFGQRGLILWNGWAPFFLSKGDPKQASAPKNPDH